MDKIELIKRYLEDPKSVDVQDTGNPFITISRQTGSSSHLIARLIIEGIKKHPCFENSNGNGWQIFDQQTCAQILQDRGILAAIDRAAPTHLKGLVQQSFLDMFLGYSADHDFQAKIAQLMLILAMLGKTILIGRGAMCITQKLPGGCHLSFLAPEPHRIANKVKELKISEKEATTLVRTEDADRVKLVRVFYNQDMYNPLLYHATFNTAITPHQEIARFAINMIAHKLACKSTAQGGIKLHSVPLTQSLLEQQ